MKRIYFYLQDFILKNSDWNSNKAENNGIDDDYREPLNIKLKKKVIEAWNKQGIIYTYLIGLQSKSKPFSFYDAVKCFDESLKYDDITVKLW